MIALNGGTCILMKNWDRLLTLSMVMHTLLRTNINKFGYVDTIKDLSKDINSILLAINNFSVLSVKQIRKIAKVIIEKDLSNELVASCISISLLIHILCILYKIDSYIVIGVVLINGKLFSHAWVETVDAKIDFMAEGYNYKTIKKFTLLDNISAK